MSAAGSLRSGRGPAVSIGLRDTAQEIDSLLCSLHRVSTSVHEDIEETRRRPTDRPSHIVDFSQFETRARQIALLRHLHSELQGIVTAVAQYGLAAETLHQEELQAMQEYIASADSLRQARPPAAPMSAVPAVPMLAVPSSLPATLGVPWKDRALTARVLGVTAPAPPAKVRQAASQFARPAVAEAPAASPPAPLVRAPVTQSFARQKIVLADQVSLDAVVIPENLWEPREVFAAVSTPELYYVPRWNHFAVRVGAVVLHGNVGRIYPTDGRESLVKVKECRLRGECPSLRPRGPPCTYYHDPAAAGAAAGAAAADVRNYVADSWVYSPAASRYSVRYGSRRLGSREALATDLQEISAGDARRFLDQVAHDVLCAIILAKYVL